MTVMSCEFESHFLHQFIFAEIAQLVEHNLAKVRVASSSLVFRSSFKRESLFIKWFSFFCFPLSPSLLILIILSASEESENIKPAQMC